MGAIVKFFEWLWLRGIKNWWSYLRWHKYTKEESMDIPVIKSDSQIINECRELYRGFDWKMDGIDDAFDTYMPAQYAYNRMTEYINNLSDNKLSGDCFTGDVKIKCLDGNSYSFKELVDSGVHELWTYGCTDSGEIVPVKAINPRKKETTLPIVKITLDNGKYFCCTEDHKIMMRDGSYKHAKDIIPNVDSLMPCYFGTINGYLQVMDNHTNKFIPVHTMVNIKVNKLQQEEAFNRSKSFSGRDAILVTHHDDFCKMNNNPDNLKWLTWGEHRELHSKDGRAITKYNKSDAHREVAAKNGPSNGRNRLIQYNISQEHRNTVINMNKNNDITVLRMRGHILKTIKKIIDSGEEFTEETYTKNKVGPSTPGWERMLHYFDTREEAYEVAKTYNHKVISIEYLNIEEYVYDVTVPETHNFLLDAGVFAHNCDDYHAGVYHMLQENGYDVALITLATIPITESHTMTAIRYKENDGSVCYKVVNYTSLKGPYKTLQDFVDNYGTPVRYWCLQKYDLEKGKYYNVDKEDF